MSSLTIQGHDVQLLAAPRLVDVRPPFFVRIICGRRPDGPTSAFLAQEDGHALTQRVRGVDCPVYRCACGEHVTVTTW